MEGQSRFIEWLEFYLRCAALRPSNSLLDTLRIVYNITVMAVCGVSGWAMFYLKYDDLSLNTDVLIHAVCTGHTLYLYLNYLANRDKLNNLIDAMNTRFDRMSHQLPLKNYKYIWDQADKWSLFLIRLGSYLCITVFSLYIYNADCFSPRRKLLYPVVVPYSLEPHFNYFFSVCLQLTIFSLYLFIHVSGHGLGIGGSHFIGASLEVLGMVFRDICDVKREIMGIANKTVKLAAMTRHDLDLREKLKWCVKTHDEILRVTRDYKSVYEPIQVEVVLACEILICFGGFQIVLAAQAGEMRRFTMLFCLIVLLTFHLFLFCYPGQHIYNKSEQFRETLYLSRWEDQDIQFQRSLGIILTNTTKPIVISFRGVIQASMPSFLHALRTAFSYVNILLILKDI